MTNRSIEAFIEAIAEPQFPQMFNPWSQTCETELSDHGWLGRQKRLKNTLSAQTQNC